MKKPIKKTWEEMVADFKSGKLKELKSRIPVYQKSGVDYIEGKEKPKCNIHGKDWSCSAKLTQQYTEKGKQELWRMTHEFRIPVLGTW